MKKFSGPNNIDGQFVDRDPNSGRKGTAPDASWLNSLQEELCSVITEDGVSLNPADSTQLSTRLHARKKIVNQACKIPQPDVYLPLCGDLQLIRGNSTAIEITDNNGTPVNTPIRGASYSLPSPVYEIDEYLNGIYPVNVARYSSRGIKLTRAVSNFFTRSWDMVNYVRGNNPNLREPTARTMFGRPGTRFTKNTTDYIYVLGVFGRKLVNADKEHTYTICYNLDFAADNKIRYIRSRLAYAANWANYAQVEIDLVERRVVSSNAIRYEIMIVDNFLILSATGKSSLTPEVAGGGSVDIIPVTAPGASETLTATGVTEIMWTQLQEDSFWAGYIETNGQEATRTIDTLTLDGKDFAVNSPDGVTFKCKFTQNTIDTSVAQYLFDIGIGTTNRLGLYIQNGNLTVTAGATGKYIKISDILKIKDENTLVVTIKNNETIKFVLNGTFVEIKTGAFVATAIDTSAKMRIGASNSGNFKNSIYIRDWTWWNTVFNAEQLLGACK